MDQWVAIDTYSRFFSIILKSTSLVIRTLDLNYKKFKRVSSDVPLMIAD